MRHALPVSRGFSLIELMAAIVIIGILTAIALPTYRESVSRARRAQAQGAILGLAQTLERQFTRANSYAGTADASNVPTIFPSRVPATGSTTFYNLTLVVANDGSGYTITATPAGPQAGDKCGSFTYTDTGLRNMTGQASGVAVADCWR